VEDAKTSVSDPRDTETKHDRGIPRVSKENIEGVLHEDVVLHTDADDLLILKRNSVDVVSLQKVKN